MTEITYAKAGDGRFEVTLDGIISNNWIEVNTIVGVGTRYQTDERGNFIIVGDEIQTETIWGQFTLRAL